ncbi:hypothetical protein QFZ66_007313 [Streptomyces sp. B4I13]|nr:hypothetical protein [Streptomyces sp. B4I13]
MGIDVEVVERNPAASGFVPQPKRWVVEQVNGIMMLHRRLVRDYEHRPASAESRVYWARAGDPVLVAYRELPHMMVGVDDARPGMRHGHSCHTTGSEASAPSAE